MNLLLLAFISHIVADFLFQSKKLVKIKDESKIKGCFYHLLIVFIVNFLLTLMILDSYKLVFFFSISISIIHIIVDIIKVQFQEVSAITDLYIFLIDQCIHFFTIYFVWIRFNNNLTIPVYNWSSSIKLYNFSTSIEKILIIIFFYLLVLFAGAILLEKALNVIDIKILDKEEVSIGRYIGIVERALILTLVTFGSISSIGIIFTAKSLARYKELDEKNFVEYYIFGTLTSLFLALVGGLFLKSIIFP